MKKKVHLFAIIAILSITSLGTRSFAADAIASENKTANTERLQQIKSRLEEIKTMNKSTLTRQDRKELRNEVKEMRHEAKEMGGGIYLSVGAIIIIILLLILIL